MKRALQSLLTTHFTKSFVPSNSAQPSKEMLDLIVESSNGDIRSAIMALQFACTNPPSKTHNSGKKGKTKTRRRGGDTRALLEAVTRREQSLALFHLVGKVLYNKRVSLSTCLKFANRADLMEPMQEKETHRHLPCRKPTHRRNATLTLHSKTRLNSLLTCESMPAERAG